MTWFYGPGVPPIPQEALPPRPMSEEFQREMERIANVFVAMPAEAEKIAYAVAVFGSAAGGG